ncbi:cation-transporting P-type ATPase C [Seleniivibrio woodruffii]|nr:cation-transporting P-type ATPase C [Seleniivibrio woodruffii]
MTNLRSFGHGTRRTVSVLKIVSSSPERVRLKYPVLRSEQNLCSSIVSVLSSKNGIKSVRCNRKCASLIVEYKSDSLSVSDIVNLVVSIKPAPLTVSQSAKADCACDDAKDSLALLSRKSEFTALSVAAGASFISKRFLGRAFSQALFSPMWMFTAFFAAPLVYSAVSKSIKDKKIGLDSFLGAGIGAALLGGETMTALEILWVNSGAELMQEHITEKSRTSIKSILDVTAKTAFILVNGREIEVPVERIEPQSTVIVRTGEKISVDGEIIRGEAMVNEAPINGRQELIHKVKSDTVYAGTYVQDGLIYIRADRVGDSTYLSRILAAVETSLENKAPIELEADRLAKKLVNIGLIMTAGTWLLTRNLSRTLSVMLVMTCPCATALAASSAVSASIGNAASKGVLIKGGRYLEDAGEQESFCFDKTGTITTDMPEVIDVHALKGFSEQDVLMRAYAAELHNRHPMAAAIRKKAESYCLEKPDHAVCETILGMGVAADTAEGTVCVGNRKLMDRFSIKTGTVAKKAELWANEGKSVLYVAEGNRLLGILSVQTKDKEGVAEMIETLRKDGVKNLIMVTGDERQSAEPLAQRLGFDECHYSVLPQDKADIIRQIQKDHKVAMIGDGINDVLALAQSDLGIAMGAAGSDVAVEAADIALVDDDLNKIVFLRQLSKKTKTIINQNFTIATSTNAAGAVLGAVGMLNPLMAGLLHIVHTGGIMANSSRLITYNGEDKND